MREIYDLPIEGKYGEFGGRFVPETLIYALDELEEAYLRSRSDREFQVLLKKYLSDYAGRPTPLYHAENLSSHFGFKIYLKREDLLHGGAHKLNNTLGQALLARQMGKKKLIAETAAGQHGFATAIAGALLNLEVEIFMGVKDIERQRQNAYKIRLYGAKIRQVTNGAGVLKDAVSEGLREWVANLYSTHYLIGSTVGPHPFPMIVRDFQSVIGREARSQVLEKEGRLPEAVVACGSGGSNALGIFYPFLKDDVELHFIEGGGQERKEEHAAALTHGSEGVLHGAYTYILQDEHGQISKTSSRSAGLNYPARGPEVAYLKKSGRLKAYYATDEEVLNAFKLSTRLEGLMPAFETSHAIAHLEKLTERFNPDDVVVVNFSGRGDKDVEKAMELLGVSL